MASLRLLCALGVGLLVISPQSGRAGTALDPDHPPATVLPQETKMGDEAVKQLEGDKNLKLMDLSVPANRALQDKLDAMVKKLGAACPRPGISYTVKVIESKDINAFTLPGGHVYVYRGLLDFVASDDELAGVFAHELGHNARLHALRGEKKAKGLNWVGLAAMAAMVLGGRGGAAVGQFSQLALVGVMNGYGVGYEKEADASGVETMRRAGYNPSAMVTFMGRLQAEEQTHPAVQLGIFATHPPSDERADAIRAQMERDGLTFNPREVSGAAVFGTSEKSDRVTVGIGDLVVLELAKTPDASQRAQAAAARLNALWKDDLRAYEVSTLHDGTLVARGDEIVRPLPADAKLSGLSLQATGQKWAGNFARVFWRMQLKGKV